MSECVRATQVEPPIEEKSSLSSGATTRRASQFFRHGSLLTDGSVDTCVEIKCYGAFVSTRRLLDGVAMPVPHRSTEPALVDFHTGVILEEKDVFIKTLIQTPKGKQ